MTGTAFGLHVPGRARGGCDDCLAYQRLYELESGIYVLRIFHDDTCPTYARKRARTQHREDAP